MKAIRQLVRILCSIPFFLLAAWPVFSQQDALADLRKKFENGSSSGFQEKIFTHIDRTLYLTGETIWLKVYLVDRNTNQLSDLSKVAYLEVTDKNNEPVLKTKIELTHGTGSGTIFLPASLTSGNYTVIAYTRWMRNFSPEYYFHQTIKIVNPFVTPGYLGNTDRPAYDIQFFPEGGNLVAGLKSSVGFRVVGKNGRGVRFRGSVVSSKNDTVVRFTPYKFGLGQFLFTPQAGQHYRAIIVDSIGQIHSKPLPDAFDEGYVVHASDGESFIRIDIHAKGKDTLSGYQRAYLLVTSGTLQESAHPLDIVNGKASIQLPKNRMREGVNRIVLFDQKLDPVCERACFITPKTKLKISIGSNKPIYQTREKIGLNFSSNDTKQIESMSVAVYRVDSMSEHATVDISSYLLLTSELRGNVESPGYYLNGEKSDSQAIDNLMVTHGWSRFHWEDRRSDRSTQFIPEYGGHLLLGRVLSLDGQPAKGINTYLSVSGKDGRVYLSQSDDKGIVHYDLQNFYGDRKIVVQANSQVDSAFRIELKDSFSDTHTENQVPEFELSRNVKTTLLERSKDMQLQYAFVLQKQGGPAAIDSIPFYGNPDEKYLLDDFTRFPTMEEVMREYVKGVMVRIRKGNFHFLTLDKTNAALFRENPLVLLDGVPVFNINKIMAYDPRKVKKVDVVTRQYYLGRLTFNGVVSYTTYHGDLLDYAPENATTLFIEGIQAKKEFFSPVYETPLQQESRIPDKRHLLFWDPHVQPGRHGKSTMIAYTSDVPGAYFVMVQALSKDGHPGTATARFNVEKAATK